MAELIKGMPFGEYIEIDAINSSTLKSMAKPKPRKGLTMTPSLANALRIGRGLDTWETGRDAWDELVIDPPINPKTEKPYGNTTQKWAAYEAEHPGKTILTEEDVRLIRQMSEALHNQPEYDAAWYEASFQDVILFEYRGYKAKAMLDLRVGMEQVWDIKTSQDVDYWGFYHSARRLNYDIQAYWYRCAMFALYGVTPDFIFAVVDKDPAGPQAALYNCEPHDCVPDWVDHLVERVVADDWALPESKQMNELHIQRDFQGEPVSFEEIMA